MVMAWCLTKIRSAVIEKRMDMIASLDVLEVEVLEGLNASKGERLPETIDGNGTEVGTMGETNMKRADGEIEVWTIRGIIMTSVGDDDEDFAIRQR